MVVAILVGVFLLVVISVLNTAILAFILLECKHPRESVKTPYKPNSEVEKNDKTEDNVNELNMKQLLERNDILDEYLNGPREG